MTTHTPLPQAGRRAELTLDRDDLWTTIADLTRAKPTGYAEQIAALNQRLAGVVHAIAAIDREANRVFVIEA